MVLSFIHKVRAYTSVLNHSILKDHCFSFFAFDQPQEHDNEVLPLA